MSVSSKFVDRQDVLYMARLSRIVVDEGDVESFARQLSDILSYMDILGEVDTAGVEPLYSPVLHAPCMREDKAENMRTREMILSNAPEREEEYFAVPRIV